MKNYDFFKTNPMEKQIFGEENTTPEQKPTTPQTEKPENLPKINLQGAFLKLKYLKRPKTGLILAVFTSILLLFGALFALSKRQTQNVPTVVKITIASPAASLDPELEQAKKNIVVFNNNLGSLDSELDNIKFPTLDLNVNF